VFVTKERYAGVLRGHPDVDRVLALGDGRDAWPELVASARALGDVDLYDLHGSWRSWRLGAALGSQARVIRAPKHGLRRRLMVFAKSIRPAPLQPLLRTYRSLAGASPADALRPWLHEALDEEERARARDIQHLAAVGGFVLLGVGARWQTKRWSVRHFAALGSGIERNLGLGALYATDVGDDTAGAELRSLVGPRRASRIVSLPFRDLAALASSATAIVSNDSAVLHLGPALGVPALGLFGSTVPAFGFARQGPRDAVAEIPLPCRPCDVHGRDRCPLGHHHCMERLTPEIVLAALRPMLAGGPA